MSQEKKYDVFISYRTVDTRLHASTLNFMINAKHPEWNVSFDHVNLYGEWPVELIRRVDNTKNVVVLVGENTFNFQSQQFEEQEVEFYRNLANAPIEEYKKQISELLINEVHIDFLRLELNRAFRNNITVIPIVIYTEKIFSIDGLKLPKDLIALKSCQGLSYHNHVLNSSNIGDLLPGIELRMNRMGEISAGSLDKSKLSTELIPYHTPEEDLKRAFANLPKGQFQYGDCIYERNIEDLTVTLKKSLTIKCSYDIDPYIIQDNVRIPLTSIGQSAFEDNSFIEFVKIPDSITSIRENSFAGCSSLRFVDIPNSIASIECGSFSGCAFSSIIIPDSVTYIGEGAFYGCTSLAVITIPNSVVKIDTCAFAGCSSLTSIIIPCSVMSIEVDAFSDCTSLSSISVEEGNPIYDSRDNCNAIIETSSNQLILGCQNTVIPNGVTSIGHGAFSDCSSLTSIVIHDSVINIGESAFSGCSSLTSITIPNSVTSIGNWAFDGCTDLTSITLPNSVTSIGSHAFAFCSGLTSIIIPNSVTSIGSSAFRGCKGLTSITIPNSVTSIGEDAFWWCSGLTSIIVEKENKRYDSRENCNAIIDTASNTLLVGCKNTFIPNSVTSIGEDAFYGCKGLTSITIPNSVTSIGNWAFKGCSGLTSITIPNSVTSIGSSAFYGCSGLTSITIPNSVKRIGDSSFIGCTFLNEIFYLGTHEQWNVINRCNVENCYSNKVIIHCVDRDVELETFSTNNSDISATPSSSSSLFNANHVDMKIRRVVANLSNEPFVNGDFIYERDKKTYSVRLKQPAWIATNEEKRISRIKKTFLVASYIELDNTPIPVSCIDKSAFKDDVYVEYIEISDGIISIENHAFSGCTALTDIIIPNSVKSIGEELFAGCLSLEYINLPNSVTSIRRKAFINCKGLTSITIPNGVTSIEEYVFFGCTSLTTIIIPNSVKSIAKNAFWGCTSLSAILVDGGNPIYDSRDNCNAIIETSSNQLILGCQNTVIPNGVRCIRRLAFVGCSFLTSINIPNSVIKIESRAFAKCTSLTSIIIPNSVKSIGRNAFYGCSSLATILVEEGNLVFDSRDNCNAIIRTATNQLIAGCKATTIPNSVTSIGKYAFYLCSSLTSITIPNSVTSIEDWAFCGCSGLTSITIPNSVTSIGDGAFLNCDALKSIRIPKSVTYISEDAFPEHTQVIRE